jgi:hypothetical protein
VKYNNNEVNEKFSILHQQTTSYLHDIKKLVTEFKIPNKLNIISYFTYSLNISHDSEQESLCLGSYHVHNTGTQSITNPYLCIKIPKESPFSFNGKYVYEHFNSKLKGQGGWERTNEKTNKEEFWLRPLGKTSIEPNEVISFSNFQITWSPKESYAGSIMGFAYSDEIKDGIAAINPINLSGTVRKREDENE